MPTYKVPVQWSRWGIHEIEADSPEQAAHYAEFLPLPFMDDFVDDSAKVLVDKIEEIKPTENAKV